jgi:hypothetical protein
MTVIEIIQLVISSGSLWFIVRCSFALGKISQRFDSITFNAEVIMRFRKSTAEDMH